MRFVEETEVSPDSGKSDVMDMRNLQQKPGGGAVGRRTFRE
jgi:hypothetical protein